MFLRSLLRLLTALLALCVMPAARADLWRTGYFPGWEQTSMAASNIDFAALTHIIHFSLVPTTSGTLNSDDNVIVPAYSSDLITRAHAAGLKVLISVGGGNTESLFQGATTTAHLPVFINNLTNFMATNGYDGIDVDWEPLPSADALKYTNLLHGLRAALNAFPTHKLISVAAGAYPPTDDPPTNEYIMFANVQGELDQINIMTYDLSGPWGGWVTWFNSPVYDGGYRFASSGGLVPSIDGSVSNFLQNGVAADKLGIGIPFYGYIWTGGAGATGSNLTGPREAWKAAPTASAYDYSYIATNCYQPLLYHWDAAGQAAYISITNAKAANNAFISYDDERACQAKVSYARNHALGGIMIWELALDHVAGSPDPLLEAVRESFTTPGSATLQFAGSDINLTFSGIPLGSYRVLWSNALTSNSWNTLLITNVTGPGGPLGVIDPGVITNQSRRFYRVQTPP